MSAMCSMKGCKEKPGLCGHEKLMLAMALAGAVALLIRHFA